MIEPIFVSIAYQDPAPLFKRFSHLFGSVLLESVNHKIAYENTNRYSYIAIKPFETITLRNSLYEEKNQYCNDPFEILKDKLKKFSIKKLAQLPPFQGGMVGYFSYDLCQFLENISLQKNADNFPEMIIGMYDTIISFDHHTKQAWIVATGFPESNVGLRIKQAKQRIAEFQQLIEGDLQGVHANSEAKIGCQITSNFSEKEYIEAVGAAKNYILNGDIFEVNLAQRFKVNLPDNFADFLLYERLCQINPAPFAAFGNFGQCKIISASPERFVLCQNRMVETRPIKGTASRHIDFNIDKKIAENLQQSPKDCAENIMIVDLMRNDLAKVCDDNSVMVEKLCDLETFATVHHLVSVIRGQLLKDKNALDLLKACFPGGSITGAPKIRAMEIIAELEPNRRGPYCGSLGFISFTGDMDTSILIRSYVIQNDTLTFHAGGAITLHSDPQQEYEETLIKANALQKALIS